ncbi:MAG: phosphatase [Acidaminobacteraceae bacterium]
MKFVLDTHVHTIPSGHAYSTIHDYIKVAKERNLELIGITDHGPAMPGASNVFHLANQVVFPRVIEGIKVLRGAEVNIIDFAGSIDIKEERFLNNLDVVIASFHDVCLVPGTIEENTAAFINAMESNKYIDIIGHPGNPKVPIDYVAFVDACKKHDIIVEINNSSFSKGSRIGSEENCITIAKLCADKGVKVIAGSDSHISYSLGQFSHSMRVIKEAKIPEGNIMNLSVERFVNYLNKKGKPISMEEFCE